MQEERMRILNMVREGVLAPADAATLLAALESGVTAPNPAPASAPVSLNPAQRWFRLRVTDADSGRVKVNLSLPLSLVDLGLRLGGLGAEVENFRTALFAAPGGKFIEVDDGEGSERVEMFVE